MGGWGWGTAFFDMDNDGDLNLVMTNGVDFPNTSIDAQFETDPMRVWENDGTGAMTEVSAAVGVTDDASGKGLLTFDYDADGDLDLFVVNNAGPPSLYRNDLAVDHDWLRVKVVGRHTHRDGGGAIVTVRADPAGLEQRREAGAGSHFLGQSERVLHFGLGPGDGFVDSVRVEFPASGKVRWRHHVRANRTLTIREVLPACGVSGAGVFAGLAAILALRVRAGGRRS